MVILDCDHLFQRTHCLGIIARVLFFREWTWLLHVYTCIIFGLISIRKFHVRYFLGTWFFLGTLPSRMRLFVWERSWLFWRAMNSIYTVPERFKVCIYFNGYEYSSWYTITVLHEGKIEVLNTLWYAPVHDMCVKNL